VLLLLLLLLSDESPSDNYNTTGRHNSQTRREAEVFP